MGKPVFTLPPYKVEYKMMTLSEVKNYGHKIHNIPEAWKFTKGENIKVAVIDTGLPNHRDLENQIIDHHDFTGYPEKDIVGHSTHVSGIISAEENGEGVVGIAPQCKLYIAKALGDSGSGSDESIANSIKWCIDKKVDIINMSLGAPQESEMSFPLTKKAIKLAYGEGIIVICAAGNESASEVGFPACMKETISVGAIDSRKRRASFSNRGPKLDLAASGVDIVSTYLNNGYASLSGTSMACPIVTGIVALILSKHKKCQGDTPIHNTDDVREHLKRISIDMGPVGFDNDYGNGLPIFSNFEEMSVPVKKRRTLLEWIKSLFK